MARAGVSDVPKLARDGITEHPQLLALHIDATHMAIQSASNPRQAHLIEHDGHLAIGCATTCQNAAKGQSNCWHLRRVNQELDLDAQEQEKALDEAQNILGFKPVETLAGQRTLSASFNFLR